MQSALLGIRDEEEGGIDLPESDQYGIYGTPSEKALRLLSVDSFDTMDRSQTPLFPFLFFLQ